MNVNYNHTRDTWPLLTMNHEPFFAIISQFSIILNHYYSENHSPYHESLSITNHDQPLSTMNPHRSLTSIKQQPSIAAHRHLADVAATKRWQQIGSFVDRHAQTPNVWGVGIPRAVLEPWWLDDHWFMVDQWLVWRFTNSGCLIPGLLVQQTRRIPLLSIPWKFKDCPIIAQHKPHLKHLNIQLSLLS